MKNYYEILEVNENASKEVIDKSHTMEPMLRLAMSKTQIRKAIF